MFDLNQEVNNWSGKIVGANCATNQRDELQDHLFSAIEELRDQGLSEQQAFEQATNSLGSIDELAQEFRKNRSVKSIIFSTLGHGSLPERSPAERKKRALIAGAFVIIASIIWSILTIYMKKTMAPEVYDSISNWMLALWYIAIFTPIVFVIDRHSARDEWICLKRNFKRRLGS